MSEHISHGDALEIIEALRENGKRLRRLAASRSYMGPENAEYRAGLRKRARRNADLADMFTRDEFGVARR
jgi:hypothetical protein